jgi:hypothetical protein
VYSKQVRGKFLYSVPHIGYAAQFFTGKIWWIVPLIGICLIAYSVFILFIRPRLAQPRHALEEDEEHEAGEDGDEKDGGEGDGSEDHEDGEHGSTPEDDESGDSCHLDK